jgi:hypothetical protein
MEVTLTTSTPQTAEALDRLLAKMPAIADAVNKFDSAEVQARAFEALVEAHWLDVAPDEHVAKASNGSGRSRVDERRSAADDADESKDADGPGRRKPRRARGQSISAERDVDFMPKGKKSLKDFASEKNPTTINERNLVAVYYIEHVLDKPSASAGQILAAYKWCGWPEPSNLAQALRGTAHAKNWIDTADTKAVRTRAAGRNMVDHQMPAAKAKPEQK